MQRTLIRNSLSVAHQLGKEVFPIVNQANKMMTNFLSKSFDVKEIHPFAKPFLNSSSPDEILHRIDVAFDKTDSEIFKSETELDRQNDVGNKDI